MKEKSENLLNQLIEQISSKEELDKIKDSLFKRGVESLLKAELNSHLGYPKGCLLYTSPSPRDRQKSRMPSSA